MNKVILAKQDLTHLNWSKIRRSSGTAGSFLKAQSTINGKKVYYKLSNYDVTKGIVGHESVNEIIVDRLLDILGIEHLHYQLIHADIIVDNKKLTTFICASEDYKEKSDSKIALDTYYLVARLPDESPMSFCIRQGFEKYIYEMLLVDFLILNRDRHGANMEVLRNSKKRTIRLAPLFDHGLSLLFQCHTQELLDKADIMADKKVQCFVGSNSATDNLELIPVGKEPAVHPLKPEHKTLLFKDLDYVLDKAWLDTIWDMIWERWIYYEDFCSKRFQ